jgi:tRNA nucleotidyltransferase (CCA-adding enzyme)
MDLLARLRAQPAGERLLAAAAPGTFLVGGAVRDLLLGRAPRELDVVVEGDPTALARTLGTPVEHPRFGTAIVELDGARIDVAGARREHYPAPGALPQVEPATLEQDLLRRDFTVNAIAVALGDQQPFGEVSLRAAPGALEDLRAGRLRVLHDASFLDDPTRLLRLARYAARLGFAVEPHTAELAARALASRALDTVSGARIGAELRLALAEPDALGALAAMDDLGLLAALDPRLRLDRASIERALAPLPDEDGRPDLLTMAALTLPLALTAASGDGAPDLRSAGEDPRAEIVALLDRFEFAAPDRDRIAAAAAAVPRLVNELPAAQRPSQLLTVVAGVPPEGIALAGGVHEPAAEPARRWLTELRDVRLTITGEDLLAAGVPEGPEIGRRLEVALRRRLDGDLARDRDAELTAALQARK